MHRTASIRPDRMVLGVQILEERINPHDIGGQNPTDPDDQLSEAFNLGQIIPGSVFVRDDQIQLLNHDANNGTMIEDEYHTQNDLDVDLYQFTVKAGDRIHIEADVLRNDYIWTNPSSPQNPNPQPFSVHTVTTLAMRLYDSAGKQVRDKPEEAGVGIPFSPHYLAVDNDSQWITYTFHAAGTYYLSVASPSNNLFDVQTGANDGRLESTGPPGKYRITLSYVEQDLPDFVADSIRVENDTLIFDYGIVQHEYAGIVNGRQEEARNRPASWHHGVELHWFDINDRDLGSIDPNSQAAANLASYNSGPQDWHPEHHLYAPLSYLGTPAPLAAKIGLVVNAGGRLPEAGSGSANNIIRTILPAKTPAQPQNIVILPYSANDPYVRSNLLLTKGILDSTGILVNSIQLSSSTGRIADLFPGNNDGTIGGIRIQELLQVRANPLPPPFRQSDPYNGAWHPFSTWKPVDFAVDQASQTATLVNAYDIHGFTGFDNSESLRPFTDGQFIAYQQFRYQTPDMPPGQWVNFGPEFQILRHVFSEGFAITTDPLPQPQPLWYYEVSFVGVNNSTRRLPLGANRLAVPGPVPTQTIAAGSGSTLTTYPAGVATSIPNPVPGPAPGNIRTAVGDFNRDGVEDYAVGTGPGTTARARVLSGSDQHELFAITPFGDFAGGLYVAAGDLNGDGQTDLIITPDEGGGPRVRVFSGAGFGQLSDFYGIEDVNFRGGARAAAGDVNGDGRVDLVVSAGFGGGPRIAAFNGATLGSAGGPKLFGDFLAFEAGLRNGAYVAVGDINGDGKAEIIAGAGPGGGPRVTIFDGVNLLASQQTRVADFFAGNTGSRGGIRLAVKDLDGDNLADLVTGSGDGNNMTQYAGSAILAAPGNPAHLRDLLISGAVGGIFVG